MIIDSEKLKAELIKMNNQNVDILLDYHKKDLFTDFQKLDYYMKLAKKDLLKEIIELIERLESEKME